MKSLKTKTGNRNKSRLAPIQRYMSYPTILDTDEDRVMKYYSQDLDTIDILDTDEDVIMQYYKHSISARREKRIHA